MEPFNGYDGEEDAAYDALQRDVVINESITARELGAWLLKRFQPRSVIDLGCSNGLYLLPYIEAGCEALGVDACSTGGNMLPRGLYTRVDLRLPYEPPQRYDMAICCEVGEHLEEEHAEQLVKNCCACADLILWTAATPGQGGVYHKNERVVVWWERIFADNGYVRHSLTDEMIAFICANIPAHDAPWMRWGSAIYRKVNQDAPP